MESLLHDLRFALRQLRRSPGFTLAAVLTLGLGIGANATIFNWGNRLFRHPLPGVDSTDLYYLRWTLPGGHRGSTSWPTFLDLRERSRTASHLAVGRQAALSLGEGNRPERVFGMLVSANFFDLLGVRAQQGRTFRPEEDRGAGAHPVAVISDALWRNQLGADPRIVGRTIRLNTHPFMVVGVMPAGFQGSTVGLRHDVWVPVTMRRAIMGSDAALTERGDRWLEAYFRTAPNASLAQAEQELNAISAQLSREIFKSDRFARVDAVPIWKHAAGQVLGPVLLVMGGVVAVILLIACANVGNLLLARAAERRREIAVRLALGVSRGRLLRQLLAENALLASVGAALALAVVPVTSGLLTAFAPPANLGIDLRAEPDWLVLVFTLGIAALATLLFGLMPAWRAARVDAVTDLKQEGAASLGGTRLRSALVVVQVALSVLLLSFAGLLLKSLGHAMAANPGFDPRGVLVASVDLLPNGYKGERGTQFVRQALARLAALPGVMSVSSVRRVPLSLGGSSSTGFSVDGYTPRRDEDMTAYVHTVGPAYFTTLRTPLIAGRDIAAIDNASRAPVAVINQTMARRYFGGADPVGRQIKANDTALTIVGVAADSKFQSLDEPAAPAFYQSVLQYPGSETNFLIRAAGVAPAALAQSVRRELRAVDAAMPVHSTLPLEDAIGASYIAQRMGGWLLAIFGGLALALAAVGLAGVLAFSVNLRRREVGIRVALGAAPVAIRNMIVGDGLRLTVAGLAIGLALAAGLSRFLGKLLYGVSPRDLATFGSVAAILVAVALAAAWLPARRAARIDPLEAMRA